METKNKGKENNLFR